MSMFYKIVSIILFANACPALFAAECPIPATAIDIGVAAKVTYDRRADEYIYKYAISNGRKARVAIVSFSFESPSDVTIVHFPQGWDKIYDDSAGGLGKVGISSLDQSIAPGSRPVNFEFRSKLKPGLVRYYSEGMPSGVRQAEVLEDDMEAVPSCPGFYVDAKSTYEEKVTGFIVGPAGNDQIDVKLKMKVHKEHPPRRWDDECERPEISPEDRGRVELVMSAPKGVDISKIDLNSIKFGPEETPPSKAELVSAKHRHFQLWRHKPAVREKVIWMEFNLSDLKVRCDLDKALFLQAKAEEKLIVGAVEMTPVICNMQLWKQMSKERHWHGTSE